MEHYVVFVRWLAYLPGSIDWHVTQLHCLVRLRPPTCAECCLALNDLLRAWCPVLATCKALLLWSVPVVRQQDRGSMCWLMLVGHSKPEHMATPLSKLVRIKHAC
jgi:hypothetical protein